MFTYVKIAIKKAFRKTWKRMPVIILVGLICGLTTLGVVNAAERISDKYAAIAIEPLLGTSLNLSE